MVVRRNLNLLFLVSLTLLGSCKKELSSDFDHIIGTWNWYETKRRTVVNYHGGTSTQLWNTAATNSDQFKIEFLKKGLIKMYKNNSLERKYRVKDFKTYYQDNYLTSGYSYWTYEINLNKKLDLKVIYYLPADSLIMGFFPFNSDNGYNGVDFINVFLRD